MQNRLTALDMAPFEVVWLLPTIATGLASNIPIHFMLILNDVCLESDQPFVSQISTLVCMRSCVYLVVE